MYGRCFKQHTQEVILTQPLCCTQHVLSGCPDSGQNNTPVSAVFFMCSVSAPAAKDGLLELCAFGVRGVRWCQNLVSLWLIIYLICPSGNRILTLGEVPKDQVYALKLKGISICFSMLKAALSGSYVNFGVFRLYGDDALDNALQTFIKLLLSIPHSDLLVSFSLAGNLAFHHAQTF